MDAAGREDWKAAVRATLKGAPFEDLITHTIEDLAIQPLYDRATAPDFEPLECLDGDGGWDIRAPVGHPDPSRANRDALEALEGGASSVLVAIDPSGQRGCAIGETADLRRALDGVELEAAGVALDAGFLGPTAAEWLAEAAKGSPAAQLHLHLDPVSAFATAGSSPGPMTAHIARAARTAADLSETYPKARLFLATGRTAHEAGGSIAQELGMMAAAAAAYARALTEVGLPAGEALARITLGLAADGDVLQSMAKMRAARRIWAQIARACQAPCPARVEARSSRRMLTTLDPWTNLIRLTAAGFAAAAGGADAVVLHPYTDALGPASVLARRLSRNIQLILKDEAHLGRVEDPAAGAFALEALTDQLAREGWGVFQAIEAQGGIVRALSSGFLASNVEAVRMARGAAVAEGRAPVLGVTLHPDPEAAAVEVEELDPLSFAKPWPDVRLAGTDELCPPLLPVRAAEGAELVEGDLGT
jgi:methylmalonyl-CoA mutase